MNWWRNLTSELTALAWGRPDLLVWLLMMGLSLSLAAAFAEFDLRKFVPTPRFAAGFVFAVMAYVVEISFILLTRSATIDVCNVFKTTYRMFDSQPLFAIFSVLFFLVILHDGFAYLEYRLGITTELNDESWTNEYGWEASRPVKYLVGYPVFFGFCFLATFVSVKHLASCAPATAG
jgi:hypothetical protein